MSIKKYNPGFLTDDELVRSYCVRTLEFESIIETLKESTAASNQHVIVVGPRGSGKTMLALRVAAEARRNADLASNWFPIIFAEESYVISTCGEFWLECLRRLSEQVSVSSSAHDLRLSYEDIRRDTDDRMLGDRCLSALLHFSEQQEKRLLLVVENLNMIFSQISDTDSPWRLRHTLQTEPRIFLFATATSRFGEIECPENALYGQFRVLDLRPLGQAECATLWESISDRSVTDRAIRALQIFAGGSPRLLAILAQFGASRSIPELTESIKNLVDDHTEYFKSYIEAMPPQERRVFVTLADIWKPTTTREVADRSRLPTNQCSAQIRRLIERGSVAMVGGTPRRKRYYLTERMFNLYYLLRQKGGTRDGNTVNLVRSLVSFMQAYYSETELKNMAFPEQVGRRLLDRRDNWIYKDIILEVKRVVLEKDSTVYELLEKGNRFLHEQNYEAAETWFEMAVNLCRASRDPIVATSLPDALLNWAAALSHLEEFESSDKICEEIVQRYSNFDSTDIRECVAKAIANQGRDRYRRGHVEESIEFFDRAMSMFDKIETMESINCAAMLCVMKSNALWKISKVEDALETIDLVGQKYDLYDAPEISEQIFISFCNKILMLRNSGRLHDALASIRVLEEKFDHKHFPKVVFPFVRALRAKVSILVDLGKLTEANELCQDIISRFDSNGDVKVAEEIANLNLDRGTILESMGNEIEAEKIYRCIVDQSLTGKEFIDDELLIMTLINQSVVLFKLGRHQESEAIDHNILDRFGSHRAPEIVRMVEKVRLNRAASELCRGEFEKAIIIASKALDCIAADSVQNRLRGHWIRAEAFGCSRNMPALIDDIIAALNLVQGDRTSLAISIENLKSFVVLLGERVVLDLLRKSSALERLYPFVVALELELGIESEVAQEVAEVASDIRLDLVQMRSSKN